MFDENVQQFPKEIAYLETHPNFRRSLLKFVIGKGQVQFQDDETLKYNFMGGEISQDDIGWYNMME